MVQRTCHLYKHAQIREIHWCFKRRQIGIQSRQFFKVFHLEDMKCIKKEQKKKTFFYRIKLVELNPIEFQKFCCTHICPYFSSFFLRFDTMGLKLSLWIFFFFFFSKIPYNNMSWYETKKMHNRCYHHGHNISVRKVGRF